MTSTIYGQPALISFLADFNDVEADGTILVLGEHATPGWRNTRLGQVVRLSNGEGDSCLGYVLHGDPEQAVYSVRIDPTTYEPDYPVFEITEAPKVRGSFRVTPSRGLVLTP